MKNKYTGLKIIGGLYAAGIVSASMAAASEKQEKAEKQQKTEILRGAYGGRLGTLLKIPKNDMSEDLGPWTLREFERHEEKVDWKTLKKCGVWCLHPFNSAVRNQKLTTLNNEIATIKSDFKEAIVSRMPDSVQERIAHISPEQFMDTCETARDQLRSELDL